MTRRRGRHLFSQTSSTELSGHWRLFVLISFSYFFCFWLRVLDQADLTRLLSPRYTPLSYRIRIFFQK